MTKDDRPVGPMKILVLDDMEQRHRTIADSIGDASYVNVYTYTDAVKAYRSTQFDLVCLDHDLADDMPGEVQDQGMYGKIYYDGADFADFMKTRPERPKVWVHSWNPVGAKVIARILSDFDVRVHPAGTWTPVGTLV